MSMQQIIARIPEAELAALDLLAEKKHISRAKAMREAVRLYLERSSGTISQEAFGICKGKDGLQQQIALRKEWGE